MPDLTLIVQIFNFIIAYIIVRSLLLQPAIDIILHEQEESTKDANTIKEYQLTNGAKEEALARRWTSCRSQLINQEKYPIPTKKPLPLVTLTRPTYDQDDQRTINATIDKIVEKITKKVSHVR